MVVDLTLCRSSLKVKIVGHSSWSQDEKCSRLIESENEVGTTSCDTASDKQT